MVWHLSNGFWWSLGCDSMSGLFKIMPRMRKLYKILDLLALNVGKAKEK